MGYTDHGTTEFNRETLPRMAALLRRDAANPTGVKFDLGTWVEPDDRQQGRNYWTTASLPSTIETSCGTKACAFGLAAISKEFAAEGLTVSTYQGGVVMGHDDKGEILFNVQVVPILNPQGLTKYDLGYHTLPTHFAAAERLFDIDDSTARYFFDPECYDAVPREAEGEIQVAERIEAYMRGEIDREAHPDFEDERSCGFYDED